MLIKLNDKKCSGCRACEQICSKKAITIEKSKQGFGYPIIDNNACVQCGICVKVCQCYAKDIREDITKITTYAAIYKDDVIRKGSQSGGLFYGLAEKVIKDNGIVYGAAVSDKNVVEQIRIQTLCDLKRLQGSKYVQSDTNTTYLRVCEDLNNGKQVLYAGTSCMIDGLYRYLNVKHVNVENLVTCDLICHGVVSPELYRENLLRIENQKHKKIININFRDKKYGWHSHMETYTFEDGSTLSEKYYTELFYSHVALRECCYECQYTSLDKKPADITMADFWGIEKIIPEIKDDNTGISLAIVRTSKGENLIKRTKLELIGVDSSDILQKNRGGNIGKPFIYSAFWKDYYKNGYEYCLRKYTIYGGVLFKLKRKILKKIKRW